MLLLLLLLFETGRFYYSGQTLVVFIFTFSDHDYRLVGRLDLLSWLRDLLGFSGLGLRLAVTKEAESAGEEAACRFGFLIFWLGVIWDREV